MAASGIWIYAAFFTAFFSALIFFSWFETLALRFLISCLSEITFFSAALFFFDKSRLLVGTAVLRRVLLDEPAYELPDFASGAGIQLIA